MTSGPASPRRTRSRREPPNVGGAQELVRLLDTAGVPPAAVLWVWREETESWRLWLAPSPKADDRAATYKAVSDALRTPEGRATGIDFNDVQYVSPADEVLTGLAETVSAARVASIAVRAAVVNGVYHPDSVVVRLAV